ncbi:hypothetical protein [Rhizobium sp. R693]|uniref:hypothetical protein n=1 Tax=Rhizobium sp. R693 TaxID=1764276 RepID=UPI0011316E6A|nr:hypothetical protein [Rhizobium sp. R693]
MGAKAPYDKFVFQKHGYALNNQCRMQTKCGFDLGALATELRHVAAFVATNSWQSPKKAKFLISERKSGSLQKLIQVLRKMIHRAERAMSRIGNRMSRPITKNHWHHHAFALEMPAHIGHRA